ncbi:tRNA glutamyl-Q(34) synthetase GluQRS [Formicincola oecophyllae]|uniref:tRNA glutamyl-Q(34) synthetase GluQRS n=1 Tax=Formicincola oecophyllae TaxID=2558361 RepID=A0A4Y6U8M7_9PROT|nr:tRNA glutamyl-Q(34) synthetase GluQRS [Formicincola oecophyllae]QDH12928.1 tRNA glutamyl-Q(34) synthetase GluQRS [Formicincola oecophyllae]
MPSAMKSDPPSGWVTRFAPSPTGRLHKGHVASALHARTLAAPHGRYLVRLEDIDQARCTEENVQGVLDDLAWLGLLPEPPTSIRRQSRHKTDYDAVLDTLRERRLIYPCLCSRADISHAAGTAGARAPDGSLRYPGTCRPQSGCPPIMTKGHQPAWRLDMHKALETLGGNPTWLELTGDNTFQKRTADAASWGDVVLARRDAGLSYHLCVTHDDWLQGVTLVTRGQDLEPLTVIHRVLQELMGWPAPRYAHHPLIMGADGHKLSKSRNSPAVREDFYFEKGLSKQEIHNMLNNIILG